MIRQGSDEWRALRLGRVTASRISDVLAQGRGGQPSASRSNYAAELVLERLTGRPQDNGFKSAAMDRGTDLEAQARAVYTLTTGLDLNEVDFVPHPSIEMAGCSPDALIGEAGGYEGKARNAAKHMTYLLGGSLQKAERDQIDFCLACTGRDWWDFHSFHPDFPDELQSHVRRIERDPARIVAIEREVRTFLSEVDDLHAKIRAKAERHG